LQNARLADQQGGEVPFGQTAVDPGGTITVVWDGGGGLLLLKLRHPPSRSGRISVSRRIIAITSYAVAPIIQIAVRPDEG
jgi:hypothetical protein